MKEKNMFYKKLMNIRKYELKKLMKKNVSSSFCNFCFGKDECKIIFVHLVMKWWMP